MAACQFKEVMILADGKKRYQCSACGWVTAPTAKQTVIRSCLVSLPLSTPQEMPEKPSESLVNAAKKKSCNCGGKPTVESVKERIKKLKNR